MCGIIFKSLRKQTLREDSVEDVPGWKRTMVHDIVSFTRYTVHGRGANRNNQIAAVRSKQSFWDWCWSRLMGTQSHVHGVISFEMTPSQDFTIEKATQTNFLSKLPCSEGLFWIFLCIFWQNSLRHQPLLFRKKVLQKCPKSFQKQGPRTSLC